MILKTLNAAGFEAYYVGGCVRDRLLGRRVHDWDITTSALPQQIMALFSHCIPTGIRHGTVTVLLDGAQAEVTTFRAEGAYLDGRHPSEVRFVPRLEEDLSRRDFTVNAMAMDLSGRVTDLLAGSRIFGPAFSAASATRKLAFARMRCGCSAPTASAPSSASRPRRRPPPPFPPAQP